MLLISGLVLLLLGVLFIGTPVAFGLGFVGVAATILFLSPEQLSQVGSIAYSNGNSLNQLIAPLFILMAEVLARGRIAEDIFLVLSKYTHRIKGGLAISATLASAVFAALCGSSPATAAAIGRISVNEMIKRGYRKDFTTGVVAAGGTLGIMIPPSISMVIYGIITETSIAKLFIAGILPGLLITALICAYILIRGFLNPEIVGQSRGKGVEPVSSTIDSGQKAGSGSKSEILQDIKLVSPPAILIVILIGSLYTGMVTPSEVAGLGAIGALILIILLGRFKISMMTEVLGSTARFSAMIAFLVIGGMTLSYIVSYLGVAQQLTNFVISLGINRWVMMGAIYLLWLILGCLIDPMSMIVLTVPFLFPVLTEMGFHPIWLGVVSTLSVEIGMITPPVGLNLFVLKAITPVPMKEIIKGAGPLVLVLLLGLLILTVFPQISLYLPSKM